jgi:hypothetical protein
MMPISSSVPGNGLSQNKIENGLIDAVFPLLLFHSPFFSLQVSCVSPVIVVRDCALGGE